VPRPLRGAPFRGCEAVAAGLLTRRQLAGPTWQRLLPDVYLHRGAELDHRQWCAAAALVLPPGAAIGGASAAYVYGADVLPIDPPVQLSLPRELRLRPHPRLSICRAALAGGDVRRFGGLPVTSPLRTAYDLARGPDLTEAVVGVDALLYRRLVKVELLQAYTQDRLRWPGSAQVRRVLVLARTEVESPMESRLRLLLVLAGLPCPILQHEVYDRHGRFVARLDLAYRGHRLGVEYDGDHHRDRATFGRDAVRLNALRAVGWTVLRFTADDVLRHPERVVAQVRAALGQRLVPGDVRRPTSGTPGT
jgi:hypothetical protein